jgi:hypothetical protein
MKPACRPDSFRPDSFDPHQFHRPIPGRQIPNPSWAPIMQPGLRPAYRAPASGCGRLNGVFDLAIALRDGQHSDVFQPGIAKNHAAPGLSPESGRQPYPLDHYHVSLRRPSKPAVSTQDEQVAHHGAVFRSLRAERAAAHNPAVEGGGSGILSPTSDPQCSING